MTDAPGRAGRAALLALLGPVVVVATLCAAATTAAAAASQGFGAMTPGGAGGPIVRVTNLNDAGPGSLREAASKGNRTIVFDVAGDIVLSDYIRVHGAFVTIDGSTAPAPGITLRNNGLGILGLDGAHDVIVRGLRIRNAVQDGIGIGYGAFNVLVERVSIQGSGDGNLDITTGAHDVTVAWSILAEPAGTQKNMLVKYDPSRISLHHNLFVGAKQRNPQVRMADVPTPSTDTTVDLRYNLVWNWRDGYGTWIADGVRANVVANFYSSPFSSDDDQAHALTVDRARAYAIGNVSADPAAGDLDAESTEGQAFPAPAVDGESACLAAQRVIATAGVRPVDAVDARYLAGITLPTCRDVEPPPAPEPTLAELTVTLTADGRLESGARFAVTDTTLNSGAVATTPTTTRFHLAPGPVVGAGARVLGSRTVSGLAPGAPSLATTTLVLPADTAPGVYYLIATADADQRVDEANETNNSVAVPVTVTRSSLSPDLVVIEAATPGAVVSGDMMPIRCTIENRGAGSAGPSWVKFYLSNDRANGGDFYLGSRTVPALATKERAVIELSLKIPPRTAPGSWFVLFVADDGDLVGEIQEGNNVRSKQFVVR